MLPETESDSLPVTSRKMLHSPKMHFNPRNANTRASLKLIVSLSDDPRCIPIISILCLNVSTKVWLKAPPPVNNMDILRAGVSSSEGGRADAHASVSLELTCSTNVLIKSGIL